MIQLLRASSVVRHKYGTFLFVGYRRCNVCAVQETTCAHMQPTTVGRIHGVSLVEACGAGRVGTVQFLIDLDDTDLDACGIDGLSPLCVAATWGYIDIVQLLLDAGCDPNVRNEEASSSTALHTAACQEHGKIILMLLQAGADATLQDSEGRTACDYASVSDGLWPLFAARGYTRTPKDVLVVKRIIRKVDPASEVADATTDRPGSSAQHGTLPFYSRPGSAYVRSDGKGPDRASSSGAARLEQVLEDAIDPLEHLGIADDDDDRWRGATAGGDVLAPGSPHSPFKTIGALWKDGF